MSERIVKKDFRETKVVNLPISKLSVEVYNSVLAGDLAGIVKIEGDAFTTNLNVLLKAIKSWNMYESETAESPLPITLENISSLPATDIEVLTQTMTDFASEVKKNTQSSQG